MSAVARGPRSRALPAAAGRASRALRSCLRSVPPLAALAACLACPTAVAAAGPSAVVEMRIEGRTGTLFEGPVRTEGHDVRAGSDSTERTCDGTNDGHDATPGPTPTAAAADAMALDSESFDGRWEAGFEDYLITRWASEAAGEGESWSLFDNDALTNVGGCQIELHEGAQVLWKLGFPTAKAVLLLAPRATTSGAPPLTARAEPGVPFEAEVLAYHPKSESEPPNEPTRVGAAAYAGAVLAPVQTSANGTETVLTESPAAVTTNTEGFAAITFTTTGWHRLKAVGSGAVRSNRLDVCVAEAGAGCGPLPPEDEIRSVSTPAEPPPETPGEPPAETPPGKTSHTTGEVPIASGASSAPSSSAPDVSVAAAQATDTLRIDGFTLTPLDDRAHGLRLAGPWSRRSDPAAWLGTVSLGASGARLGVSLAAGRPALVLRDMASPASILCLFGRTRRTLRLAAVAAGHSRLVLLPRREHAGKVELHVLRGRLGLDGVGLLP